MGVEFQPIVTVRVFLQTTLSTDAVKEDYSDLPPMQRRKKLTVKIQELQHKISQETAAYEGLMKMKTVYESNSVLGDPMTVEGQLNESGTKLEKLKGDLRKFQHYLEVSDNAQNGQNSPHTDRHIHNGQRSSRWVLCCTLLSNTKILTIVTLQTFQRQ